MSNVVERLRALMSAATPGRWHSNSTDPMPYEIRSGDPRTPDLLIATVVDYGMNADAIVALHNASPAILAVVEAALAEREALFNDDDNLTRKRKYVAARKALFAALAALEEVAP